MLRKHLIIPKQRDSAKVQERIQVIDLIRDRCACETPVVGRLQFHDGSKKLGPSCADDVCYE